MFQTSIGWPLLQHSSNMNSEIVKPDLFHVMNIFELSIAQHNLGSFQHVAMKKIHIRNIFRVFVPLSGTFDRDAILTPEPNLGFTLTQRCPEGAIQYRYNIELFTTTKTGANEYKAEQSLSWAKRQQLLYQTHPETNQLAGVILRLKVNQGVFDFRKLRGQSARISVDCFQAGVLLQQGGSLPLELLPKKRSANEASISDEVLIPIEWGNMTIYDNSEAVDINNNNSSNDNQDENYPMQYYSGSESEGVLTSEMIIQPSPEFYFDNSEPYMLLFNGNAEVVGNFRALNFYKASDIRIKEDICLLVDQHDCRDTLLKINGVNYKFKPGTTTATQRRFIGYIAQQVESVVPEAVQLIDGILHVDYESLIPFLSESIRQNFNDIQRNESETQRLHRALDSLYEQFTHQNAPQKDSVRRSPNMSKRWIALWSIIGVTAIIAVAFLMMTEIVPLHEPTEREVLEEFFHATGGPYWHVSTGWMTNTSICEWYKVQCGKHGTVIEISLSSNNLTGTLPGSLRMLSVMHTLDLSNNTLYGTLPQEFNTDLKSWHRFDISHCQFTGTLPANFDYQRIDYVDLSHNQFYGTIPPHQRGLYQFVLDFSSNNFEGPLPTLPKSIGDLLLANNRFNGTIQPLRHMHLINHLDISNNELTGEFSLSDEVEQRGLIGLDISGNQFTSIKYQQKTPLSQCNASNNAFSCPIPGWFLVDCNAECT